MVLTLTDLLVDFLLNRGWEHGQQQQQREKNAGEMGGEKVGGEASSTKVGVGEIGGTVEEGENKLKVQLTQADLRRVRGGEEEMREEE